MTSEDYILWFMSKKRNRGGEQQKHTPKAASPIPPPPPPTLNRIYFMFAYVQDDKQRKAEER